MAKSARNETRKLTATYINSIAVAVLSAGAIGPALTAVSGVDMLRAIGVCIAGSVALHVVARLIIWRMESESPTEGQIAHGEQPGLLELSLARLADNPLRLGLRGAVEVVAPAYVFEALSLPILL